MQAKDWKWFFGVFVYATLGGFLVNQFYPVLAPKFWPLFWPMFWMACLAAAFNTMFFGMGSAVMALMEGINFFSELKKEDGDMVLAILYCAAIIAFAFTSAFMRSEHWDNLHLFFQSSKKKAPS